ncbi:fungal-specific transcription factor domain-containing protein [Chlamydoabsidia padenii]|nr:fungal-specific transcription factor domain-containing protein [Chlamydoabsidia padenii]
MNNTTPMKFEDDAQLSEDAKEKKRLRITRACEGPKKRGPPKGYIDALEKRIQQIESTLTSLPTKTLLSPTTNSPHPTHDHNKEAFISVHKKVAAGGQSDSVQYLGDLSSFQFLSNKIKIDGTQDAWKGQRLRKFGKQVVLVGEGEPSSSSSLYMQTIDICPRMNHVPKIKTLFPDKDIHSWIYSVSGVDTFTSDRLLKIYFANIHPVLPVVNKTTFLKQYRDQCDSYPSPDLLNAMFGAAARFVECESQYRDYNQFQPPDMVWDVPLGWSDHFFEQSQAFVTQSSSLATLSKVQSIILIHNHSGNLDSKSSACWLLGGLAVRLAQGLGLYRDCEEWDLPASEKETRKRVWWALYVTDRFHSASLGRPISIRDEDTDVGYPDPAATWKEVMDEPDNENDTGPRFPSATCKPPNAQDKVEIYQLFIQLVKLSEVLGRILQGLYTPKAQRLCRKQGSDAIVTRLDHELTEWRFGFPKALQQASFGDFDENTGYLSPVIATTLVCYYGLLVLLHRPFIERAGTGTSNIQSSYSSFRIGSSAAARGTRIASHMEPRDILMFPYAFSLYPILQCCLIHMYNTKNSDTKIAGPAKVDLIAGLGLINRLKKMSPNAEKLHDLLETIMENNSITLNQGHGVDDNTQWALTSPTVFTNPGTNENTLPSNFPGNSKISSFHSSPLSQPLASSSSPNIMTSRLFRQAYTTCSLADLPCKEKEKIEHHILTGLFYFYHFFFLVMSSTSSPSSSANEAFSLKQFGFDTPGDPNQLDFTMQDVYASLYSSQQQQQQQQPLITAASGSPTTLDEQRAPHIPAMTPIVNHSQIGNTVFRYNANNPFFGIPSSMDWSDIAWNQIWIDRHKGLGAWLLR